jgi:Glycosyl transferase family 2
VITVAALIAVRDEAVHLPHVVEHLIEEGIDVVVLDDGSVDGGIDSLSDLAGHGLIEVRRRPGRPHMSVVDLVEWKATVAAELGHDWVIHHDADEWMTAPAGPGHLIELLEEADAEGATVLNFEEFVFVPIDGLPAGADPRRLMIDYYFYEPSKIRLMRAWRRDAGLSPAGAGHRVVGDALALYPVSGVLRHYPIVTPELGLRQYGSRRFDPEELEQSLHRNRLPLVNATSIPRAGGPLLHRLDSWDASDFDRSTPSLYHFWEDGFAEQHEAVT